MSNLIEVMPEQGQPQAVQESQNQRDIQNSQLNNQQDNQAFQQDSLNEVQRVDRNQLERNHSDSKKEQNNQIDLKSLVKIQGLPKLQISSHTWMKESHGLFDYDLKDVMTVKYDATDHTSILRQELNVQFSESSTENLIAKISHSEDRHWWIYHQNKYSGSNSKLHISKDQRYGGGLEDNEQYLDLIKDEDLFKNPERMLWKVVKYSYDPLEKVNGHRLMKGDVIKIGRVRFKIRDIQSPAYKKLEQKHKIQKKQYQQKVKKEVQSILQEQLDTYRSNKIAKIEQIENEKLAEAVAMTKNEFGGDSQRYFDRQNTEQFNQDDYIGFGTDNGQNSAISLRYVSHDNKNLGSLGPKFMYDGTNIAVTDPPGSSIEHQNNTDGASISQTQNIPLNIMMSAEGDQVPIQGKQLLLKPKLSVDGTQFLSHPRSKYNGQSKQINKIGNGTNMYNQNQSESIVQTVGDTQNPDFVYNTGAQNTINHANSSEFVLHNTNQNIQPLPSLILNDDYAIQPQPGSQNLTGAQNTQTIEHRVINGMINPSTRRNRFQMMMTSHQGNIQQAQGANQEVQMKRIADFQRQETGFDSSAYGNDTIRFNASANQRREEVRGLVEASNDQPQIYQNDEADSIARVDQQTAELNEQRQSAFIPDAYHNFMSSNRDISPGKLYTGRGLGNEDKQEPSQNPNKKNKKLGLADGVSILDSKAEQSSSSGAEIDDLGADDMEDDEVIVLEADNNDFFDNEMMQYFERGSGFGDPVNGGLGVNHKLKDIAPDEQLCRICLGEEDDVAQNPLLSPCKCTGSMGLIHVECLKEWLKGKKIQRLGETVSTYFWKNLECELCKSRFPIEIELQNKQKVAILDYEIPIYQPDEQPHYITLESISSNTSKVVHVLNLIEEDEISMGRGHDISVRVTDISVSRCHSYIRKSPQGFFYMLDNNSKFGSLALVRQPTLINSQCNNVYQIGKTLLMFEINRPLLKLSFWQDCKFTVRKLFGCFKPESGQNQLKSCCCKLCFSESLQDFLLKLKEKDLHQELRVEAPNNDELSTHDGVIYFPKDLLPDDQDYLGESMRAAGTLKSSNQFRNNSIHDIVPSFILKSKQLNLKLKIKNSQSSKRKHQRKYRKFGSQSGYRTQRHVFGGIPGSRQMESAGSLIAVQDQMFNNNNGTIPITNMISQDVKKHQSNIYQSQVNIAHQDNMIGFGSSKQSPRNSYGHLPNASEVIINQPQKNIRNDNQNFSKKLNKHARNDRLIFAQRQSDVQISGNKMILASDINYNSQNSLQQVFLDKTNQGQILVDNELTSKFDNPKKMQNSFFTNFKIGNQSQRNKIVPIGIATLDDSLNENTQSKKVIQDIQRPINRFKVDGDSQVLSQQLNEKVDQMAKRNSIQGEKIEQDQAGEKKQEENDENQMKEVQDTNPLTSQPLNINPNLFQIQSNQTRPNTFKIIENIDEKENEIQEQEIGDNINEAVEQQIQQQNDNDGLVVQEDQDIIPQEAQNGENGPVDQEEPGIINSISPNVDIQNSLEVINHEQRNLERSNGQNNNIETQLRNIASRGQDTPDNYQQKSQEQE